jgi:hypothetical protein
MANPQYPMQPMQQMPGQMPQHQMPQPGMPPPPAVVRRGTSRAVPIVVSAGLAVGVFCGLLFGVGTGEPAAAAPSKGNNVKAADPSETTPTPTAKAPDTSVKKDPPPTVKPTVVAAATGSGGTTPPATGTTPPATGTPPPATGTPPPATGAGAGSAKAVPAVNKAKILVELKPDTIVPTAKITVDGQEITGGTLELDLGDAKKKEVKLVVKASGYKDHEQKVEVEGDTTVRIEMIKRASAPAGGLKRPPPPGGKKKPPGGGLIDI